MAERLMLTTPASPVEARKASRDAVAIPIISPQRESTMGGRWSSDCGGGRAWGAPPGERSSRKRSHYLLSEWDDDLLVLDLGPRS